MTNLLESSRNISLSYFTGGKQVAVARPQGLERVGERGRWR